MLDLGGINMKKTICALVAAVGMAGCGGVDYTFSGKIDEHTVTYEIPSCGREHLVVTGGEKVAQKEFYISGALNFYDDTADFLNSEKDISMFCVQNGNEKTCFNSYGMDRDTYPEAFAEANKQARYWISKILDVKRARALDLVKETPK